MRKKNTLILSPLRSHPRSLILVKCWEKKGGRLEGGHHQEKCIFLYFAFCSLADIIVGGCHVRMFVLCTFRSYEKVSLSSLLLLLSFVQQKGDPPRTRKKGGILKGKERNKNRLALRVIAAGRNTMTGSRKPRGGVVLLALLFYVLCSSCGVAALPKGFATFFRGSTCPSGWSRVTTADGRLIVAADTTRTLGGTVGTALSDQEVRSHSHSTSCSFTFPELALAATLLLVAVRLQQQRWLERDVHQLRHLDVVPKRATRTSSCCSVP